MVEAEALAEWRPNQRAALQALAARLCHDLIALQVESRHA